MQVVRHMNVGGRLDISVSIRQTVWDAARLPFQYPVALFKSSIVFLLLSVACQVDMALPSPFLYFSGRLGDSTNYFNWHFSILFFLSLLPLLNFVMGWFRLGYASDDLSMKCGWWNIDYSAIRFLMQSIGIVVVLCVVFLLGMIVAIPAGMLGDALRLDKVAEAIIGTTFELAMFWFGFQMALALVSTAVDHKPLGLFDAWIMQDGTSFRAALALWLISKAIFCLQFGLIWMNGDTPLGYLADYVIHLNLVSEDANWGMQPIWVVAVNTILDFAGLVWWTGFVVLVYKRFRATEPVGLQAEAAKP